MKSAPFPENETERLALIRRLDILDTVEEQSFDDLTFLAATACQVPISLVCIIDQERQWFKSHYGLDTRETPRDYAFCSHAILAKKAMVISDSSQDERFKDNPLVEGAPHAQFYAGIPLELEEDLLVGTLCVIDSKPRELSSQQLDSLNALARQTVAQLNLRLKLKEIERLGKLQGEFSEMVNHELKTHLTSILGSLSLLKSGKVDLSSEQYQELLSTSLHSSESLLLVINDILELNKLNLGKMKIEKVEGNINECIEESLRLLKDSTERHKTKVSLELNPKIPPFKFDRNRIIQVLQNLISNAIKASPDESKLIITSTFKDRKVCVSVQDFGLGIPESKKAEIFTNFAHITKSLHEDSFGIGFGLIIAKEIVGLHGGHIGFESQEGKGSTFYFDLFIE